MAATSLGTEAMLYVWRFYSGVHDALQYQQLWPMLRKSRELWHACRDALLFNIIWMAVSFCKRCLIFKWVHILVGEEGEAVMEWIFLLLWNIPIYILLIILSIFWNNTIVYEACILAHRRPYRQLDAMQVLLESSKKVADEVYRMLVVAIFYLIAKLLQMLLTYGLQFFLTISSPPSCSFSSLPPYSISSLSLALPRSPPRSPSPHLLHSLIL